MSNSASILQVFNESDEKVPLTEAKANAVLEIISTQEKVQFTFVELVYVNEEEIVRINKEHLEHYYVTDIITFRYDEGAEKNDNTAIEATLYCCAPRIIEQSAEFKEPVEREFQRIFIHGLLHLVGYQDDSESKKTTMTALEEKYLNLADANK